MNMNFLLGCGRHRFSDMPLADRNSTVGCILLLRCCEVISAGILLFAAKQTYNLVKDHPDVQHAPNVSHVLLSQQLVYFGALATFIWMYVGFFLILVFKDWWILLYGIIDLTLALTLSIGAGLQGDYLPGTRASCKHADKWVAWRERDDGTSFFQLAALYKTKTTASEMCRTFVSVWTVAVVVIFFQWITAYVGIFSDEREHSILNPFRPFTWFLVIVFGTPCWAFQYIVPRTRYYYRYLSKVVRRVRGQEKLEFPYHSKYTPKYGGMQVSNPGLQSILSIEHVLLAVIENLHYNDVINLSLASKCVREAVFPGGDMAYRVPKLQYHSCNEGSESRCLYCNKKICEGCREVRYAHSLSGARHFQACKPYCSKCYFTNYSKHPTGYKKACPCQRTDNSFLHRYVCRACALIPDIKYMQETRNKRYHQKLRDQASSIDLASGTKLQCAKCKNELKDGVRWWICISCKGECRDSLHPPFSKREKEPDLEMGEKEGSPGKERPGGWRNILRFTS